MVVGYFITNQQRDMILDENPIRELENPVPIIRSFPFELDENEAVISYKFKGKIKYFKIASVKKEKSLFLPSALK